MSALHQGLMRVSNLAMASIKNDGCSSYAISTFAVSTGVRDDGTGFLAVEVDGREHLMQLSAEARRHLARLLWPEGVA